MRLIRTVVRRLAGEGGRYVPEEARVLDIQHDSGNEYHRHAVYLGESNDGGKIN